MEQQQFSEEQVYCMYIYILFAFKNAISGDLRMKVRFAPFGQEVSTMLPSSPASPIQLSAAVAWAWNKIGGGAIKEILGSENFASSPAQRLSEVLDGTLEPERFLDLYTLPEGVYRRIMDQTFQQQKIV